MAVTVRFHAQVTVETAHVIYTTERAFNVIQDGLECIVMLVLLFNIFLLCILQSMYKEMAMKSIHRNKLT